MQARWNKQQMAPRTSQSGQMSPVGPMREIVNNHIVDYPTPSNMSYYWGFGSLAGRMLVVQLVTGIFLAMHYTPHVTRAFSSVEHIMRDVNYGWLLRYLHANGASFFL